MLMYVYVCMYAYGLDFIICIVIISSSSSIAINVIFCIIYIVDWLNVVLLCIMHFGFSFQISFVLYHTIPITM